MYPLKTKSPYNPDNLAATANIYTTMYLGNYITWDYRQEVGSHPWVDIVPQVKHDNIYACLDWVVHFAGTSASNGNYIILKHSQAPDPKDLAKTTTLYSCHLHLSELGVETWQLIEEWDIIGKSWNTGNSTGEHLHFQIDTGDALFHPYWPFTFKEASEAWFGFFEAVNNWLWIDNARKYTINPLVYLDNVSRFKWNKNNLPIIEEEKVKPIEENKTITHNLSSNNFQTKSKYFNDVSDNIEEIDFLYEKWVTKWYSDGTFRPNSNISRAELLIMVYKFAGINPTQNGKTFSDVNSTDFFAKYIADASSKWYISWYSDGAFWPNNPVTRAEAIAITLNIIVGKNNIPNSTDSDYQDIKNTDWFCKYANYVAQNWLLDSIGKFYPQDNMKRWDFAVLLYNLK